MSIGDQLRKILVVIKMRGGKHSNDIREYEITSEGLVILDDRLTNYQGLITGIPQRLDRPAKKRSPRVSRNLKARAEAIPG